MSNASTTSVQQRIDDLVKSNRVVLFMKGTAQFRSAASPAARCRSCKPARCRTW